MADAVTVLNALRKSPLQPIACEFVGPKHAVWLRFGEHPRAVEMQLAQLPSASWKVYEGTEEAAAWERLRAVYAAMGPILLRVVGKPTDIPGIIDAYGPQSWIAHAMNGIVLMTLGDMQSVEGVRRKYPAIVERAPREIRRRLGTFGVQGSVKRLMMDMKRTYDPERRLNPGRHIDGE
jgi:hypothetical protein